MSPIAWQRGRRGQRAQAIVLIAIMLAVVVGMAALAIDGARAYSLRRDLQAAVDAAALAGGDKLQQSGSYTSAEQAATTIFGANMRLYAAPTCAPGYGAPGASPRTITCTYPDGTVLTQVVSALGPAGSQLVISGASALQLQFARILTNGTIPRVGSAATSNVNNLLFAPTITALDEAGCGGFPGSAISINGGGGGTFTVVGDVVSNGAISLNNGASLQVAGDIYDRCQAPVPGAVTNTCYPSGAATPCTFPDVAGSTYSGRPVSDPAYPPPTVAGGSQGAPGVNVVLSPGSYAADPDFSSSVCYFLSPGVYKWQAGYTNAGGFVSNDLKPPDEPSTSNNTVLANQMWDTGGVNCAGSFQVSDVSSVNQVKAGTWAIEVTAARTDTYAGTNYKRESAPSMCRTVQVNGGQAIQIQISNVPGATSYNVYAEPPPNPACSGPFGYAGSVPVVGSVQNNNTSPPNCPAFSGTTCSLGNESAIFDSTILSLSFAPNPFVAPGVLGAYPPASETPPLRINLPNQNPDRGTPPGGDRANENQCDTIGGAATTCPGAITPGAVEFYIPSGGCLDATTSADNFLFSGYQYDWMMVYEPGASYPPANTCSNLMGAYADSAWVGVVYTPSAALTVQKAATFRTEATGGLIADTILVSGQLPTIIGSASFQPAPPATRLTG
jgi:putative Flp pilus-assembly TadE/G-like protein